MPIPDYLVRNLKVTLSELYPDSASAERVAADAGIETNRLNLKQSPANAWHVVVEESISEDKIERLVSIARSEYNEDTPQGRMLDVIRDGLRAWRAREDLQAQKKRRVRCNRIDLAMPI